MVRFPRKGLNDRTDFTAVRCLAASNDVQSNSRFRFQGNVVKVNGI
jgi:hypothetical protein